MFKNIECLKDGAVAALEQSGTVVTEGYTGNRGTEHYSAGEFDEHGKGPSSHVFESARRLNSRHNHSESASGRRLAEQVRLGFRCHHYDEHDEKFTKEYDWQHCTDMVVGETYEVHWPHSSMGACNTPDQYQTPFYDGVFCRGLEYLKNGDSDDLGVKTSSSIGVQGQIFTIVNDENYYYPDLMRGMIVDGVFGKEMTKYTGSTTGTSRNNVICSAYTPITWQVDRKCHLISASSFDKMCADMKTQRDDMSGDLYPHGARELVDDAFAADNHEPRM